ncbi:MAG: phosphoribosylamine--glycine ligase, partial [Sedimentisphaerales bacterium]|nr:phosphoribosylamine--glycine ligase [Sedimentisphaerales bacterium]
MKVLLIGGGGREHALAWRLRQSKQVQKLWIAPGNPGTAQEGENVDIADTDT